MLLYVMLELIDKSSVVTLSSAMALVECLWLTDSLILVEMMNISVDTIEMSSSSLFALCLLEHSI